MMGIKFNGHPDLRRILMWDGYLSSRCERIFRSQDCRAICPMSPSPKSHPLKAVPLSQFQVLQVQKIASRVHARGNRRASLPDALFLNHIKQLRPVALFPACAWRPLRLAAEFHRVASRAFVPISDRRCGCATSIRG